jgi:hypothetical protein
MSEFESEEQRAAVDAEVTKLVEAERERRSSVTMEDLDAALIDSRAYAQEELLRKMAIHEAEKAIEVVTVYIPV